MRKATYFGPFALSSKPLSLTRQGKSVALRIQGLKLLELLIQNSGNLVSHEDIRAHLWSGLHVDYKRGIHLLVREIRAALSDDAQNPIYLETVPRQGYRFIIPVKASDRELQSAYLGLSLSNLNIGHIASVCLALILVTVLLVLAYDSKPSTLSPTTPAQTSENYLKGAYLLKQNHGSLDKAAEYFKAAITQNETVPHAYLGLAEIAYRRNDYDTMELQALKTLASVPGTAEAHYYLSIVAMRRDWNWEETNNHISLALQKKPNDARFYAVEAMLRIVQGQFTEAVSASNRSLQIDPASALIKRDHGWIQLYAGKYLEAYDSCGEANNIAPSNLNSLYCQLKAATLLNAEDKYRQTAEHITEVLGGDPMIIQTLRNDAQRKGRDAFATWLVSVATESNEIPLTAADKALLLADFKGFDEAAAFLDQAVREKDASLPFYLRDPVFAPHHNDQRYIAAIDATKIHLSDKQ